MESSLAGARLLRRRRKHAAAAAAEPVPVEPEKSSPPEDDALTFPVVVMGSQFLDSFHSVAHVSSTSSSKNSVIT